MCFWFPTLQHRLVFNVALMWADQQYVNYNYVYSSAAKPYTHPVGAMYI